MPRSLQETPEGYIENANGAGIANNHNRDTLYHNNRIILKLPYGLVLENTPRTHRTSRVCLALLANRVMSFRRCSFMEAIEIARGIPDFDEGISPLERGLHVVYRSDNVCP